MHFTRTLRNVVRKGYWRNKSTSIITAGKLGFNRKWLNQIVITTGNPSIYVQAKRNPESLIGIVKNDSQ